MIDLRSEQMIQHVHGGGEQDALIRLAGLPSEDAGEESFAHAGIADQHQIGALLQKGEIEQAQDAVLGLRRGSCGGGSEKRRCWAATADAST